MHKDENVLDMLMRSDHSVFTRLRKKYTAPGSANGDKSHHINYKPMQILLEAGLWDTAVEFCARRASGVGVSEQLEERDFSDSRYHWSVHPNSKASPFNKALSACMSTNSPYTEPTKSNPEVLTSSFFINTGIDHVVFLLCCSGQ